MANKPPSLTGDATLGDILAEMVRTRTEMVRTRADIAALHVHVEKIGSPASAEKPGHHEAPNLASATQDVQPAVQVVEVEMAANDVNVAENGGNVEEFHFVAEDEHV